MGAALLDRGVVGCQVVLLLTVGLVKGVDVPPLLLDAKHPAVNLLDPGVGLVQGLRGARTGACSALLPR